MYNIKCENLHYCEAKCKQGTVDIFFHIRILR